MQNKEHVVRLCLLAKLHMRGAAALTRKIGYTTSNLISVLVGRYNMSPSVEARLSEALCFNSEGFHPSAKVVSWLARQVDDVLHLLDHGFEIQLLARFISDRETAGSTTNRSVLYQMALLHVKFGQTDRFVVLRMTKGGIGKLLEADQMKQRVLLAGESVCQSRYRYLDLPAWMEIDAIPWSEDQLQQLQTMDEQRDWLLNWLSEHVKLQPTVDGDGDGDGDGDDETPFDTKLRSMLFASYELRSEQDGCLRGVTTMGQQRKVSVRSQRATEPYIELAAEGLFEHLIVCQERVQGLVEVLYEGPTRHVFVGLGSTQANASGSIRILPRQLRERNSMVAYEDHIKDKVVQQA